MKKAFTLIELLVVIAIIALLSTLSVVALNSARAKSRDARRLSDIKNTQTALEMYFDEAGEYPAELTAGSQLAYGGLVFMSKVPSDPLGSNQYNYAQTESGQNYTLDFTIESKAGDYEPGNYQATPKGIAAGGGGSTPPATWVCGNNLIDGGIVYPTVNYNDFYCLMLKSLERNSNNRLCFNDLVVNCSLYGGLYSQNNTENLCPVGWVLPSKSFDNEVFGLLVQTEKQGFGGFYNGDYKPDSSFLMLEESGWFIDVDDPNDPVYSTEVVAASVRCVMELY